VEVVARDLELYCWVKMRFLKEDVRVVSVYEYEEFGAFLGDSVGVP